jgi:hypothetical protein
MAFVTLRRSISIREILEHSSVVPTLGTISSGILGAAPLQDRSHPLANAEMTDPQLSGTQRRSV